MGYRDKGKRRIRNFILENHMEVLQKIKIELPHDPAIPLLGIYPKESRAGLEEKLYTHVHSSSIHKSQEMEATQMSVDR